MDTENKAPTELRFAWRQRQQEIDNFVEGLPSEPISTAVIVAQHAAGKSTTLLAHISDLLQHDEASKDTPILYVVPSLAETHLLRHFVHSAGFKPDTKAESCFSMEIAPAKVYMTGFGDAVEKFPDLAKSGDQGSLLVVLDLENSPTTEGEVLLGLALEWAAACASGSSSKRKGNGLVLLSSYHSPRTIKSMTRVIGRPPRVIAVPEVSVNVGMDLLENADGEHIRRLMDSQHPGRVLVHFWQDWVLYLARFNVNRPELREDDDGLRRVLPIAQSMNAHVFVASQFPYSSPLAGLRYIFSSYRVKTYMFRSEVVQPVVQIREITKLEHLRELSWAHKAQVPDDVMFYRPEPYVTKPLVSDTSMDTIDTLDSSQ